MRCIHTADIHLDSPLRGLSAYQDAPADQLRGAPREAFGQLITTATATYRERKQGPLLQRASALFAGFRLGGFGRLVPDFKTTPRTGAGSAVADGGTAGGG